MLATKQKKVTEYPGIGEAAKTLGVHRITLWRTLKGHYPDNNGLLKRYRALKKSEGAK